MDRLLEFGATKLVLSLTLAFVALFVQRSVKRPQITHVMWLLVIASMFVPAMLQFPARRVAELLSPSTLISYWWQIANAVHVTSVVDTRLANKLSLAVGLLWICTSMVALGWSVLRVTRFRRVVRLHSITASPAIHSLAAQVASGIGVYRIPGIRVIDALVSPLVWFTGREPFLLLPRSLLSSLNDNQLRLILAHEIAHIKRRDHWTRWLEWMATIVFWWNPITWVARRHIRDAEELCCDALVLTAHPMCAQSYANTLLAVIEFLSSCSNSPSPELACPMASCLANRSRMEALSHRLQTIVSNAPQPSLPAAMRRGIYSVAFVILAVGLLRPVDAQQWNAAASIRTSCDAMVAAGRGSIVTARDLKANCDRINFDDAIARIEAAVQSGAMTSVQGHQKLAAIKRRAGSGDR